MLTRPPQFQVVLEFHQFQELRPAASRARSASTWWSIERGLSADPWIRCAESNVARAARRFVFRPTLGCKPPSPKELGFEAPDRMTRRQQAVLEPGGINGRRFRTRQQHPAILSSSLEKNGSRCLRMSRAHVAWRCDGPILEWDGVIRLIAFAHDSREPGYWFSRVRL